MVNQTDLMRTNDFSRETDAETTGSSTMTTDGEKKQPCDRCGQVFKRINSHKCKGNEMYECTHPECGKVFAKKTSLKQHVRTHRQKVQTDESMVWNAPRQQILYTCKHCKKILTSFYNLKSHIARFHQPKTYKCDLCPKSYGTKFDLQNHVLAHKNRKAFKCLICQNKAFCSQYVLKEHMLSAHDQEASRETHNCDGCKKRFATKSVLKQHQKRAHCKVYECEVCNEKLTSKRSKNDHIRAVHTGKKGIPCHVCQQLFATKKLMEVHQQEMHRIDNNNNIQAT